jgi:aryl-alcohol dehydrogenase-like predicted oxidoreductase
MAVYPENSRSLMILGFAFRVFKAPPSVIEGTKESLERLGLDYVDVIFAHRADPNGKLLLCRVLIHTATNLQSQSRWKKLFELSTTLSKEDGSVMH